MLTSLMVEGEELVNFEDIANEAISFFDRLYKKKAKERPSIDNLFESRLPSDQVVELEKLCSEEEVKNVIFVMDGAKAPSPNWFSMFFYQECQETIKDDIMKMFNEFFKKGVTSKAMRSTFIVLVPKTKRARSLGDYRPISLVSSLYKIISKVLSSRLRGVMGWVISSTKSAFIQERQILGSILIANECTDSKWRNRGEGVVCKLDMEKAYNRVDWGFLFWVMGKKGFGNQWMSWMEGCIIDLFFSILVNGTSIDFFKSSRVLHQGDPLSPFLFSLVVDGVSAIIRKA